MSKPGNMKTPNSSGDEFLIPLFRGSKVDVFTTCRGEINNSGDPYSGFSLCNYTGDAEEHVDACRRMLADRLGVDASGIVVPRQTHGSRCETVCGPAGQDADLYGVDALVTSGAGVVIGINTADCLPVVLVDDVRGVAGVAHAGWRGALAGVVQETVRKMLCLGAELDAVEAFMGPCICTGCFEVGDEVSSRFPTANVRCFGKPHVDLAGYVRDRLLDSGVSVIHLPRECTRCNPTKYYSARAMGIASGRNLTFAVVKKKS